MGAWKLRLSYIAMPKRDRIRELLDKSPRNSVPSQSVPHRPAVQNVLNEPTAVTTTAGGAAATKTAVTTQMATGNRGLQLATNDISMPFRRLTRTPSARLPSRSRMRAFFPIPRPTMRTTNRRHGFGLTPKFCPGSLLHLIDLWLVLQLAFRHIRTYPPSSLGPCT
jgi:hypothetical protein